MRTAKEILELSRSDFSLEVEKRYRENPNDGYIGILVKLAQEIGCDPSAFKKKLNESIVDNVEAEAYNQRMFLEKKRTRKKSKNKSVISFD